MIMGLKEGREKYAKGEIKFSDLEKIFFEKGTQKQIENFCKAPVWDRPGVIIGKSLRQRNKEWKELLTEKS